MPRQVTCYIHHHHQCKISFWHSQSHFHTLATYVTAIIFQIYHPITNGNFLNKRSKVYYSTWAIYLKSLTATKAHVTKYTPPPPQQKKSYFLAMWNSCCSMQCLLHGMWVNVARYRLSIAKKRKRGFDKRNFNPEKPTDMKSENSISLIQISNKFTALETYIRVMTIWKEASWLTVFSRTCHMINMH
jgi:hypothetical protein